MTYIHTYIYWYIHIYNGMYNGILFRVKKKEILPFSTSWVKLEGIN